MREIHGVADAKRSMMIGETDDVYIRVIDGKDRVILHVPHSPCSMTVEHARFIAACLTSAADRVEGGESQ